MAGALTTYVEENHVEYQKGKFIAGGGFFDEIDMKKRYKDKPEQLANIFQNARSFVCGVRNTRLWQDPNYEAIGAGQV